MELKLQPKSKLTEESDICEHTQLPLGFGVISAKKANGRIYITLLHKTECTDKCGEFYKVIAQKDLEALLKEGTV